MEPVVVIFGCNGSMEYQQNASKIYLFLWHVVIKIKGCFLSLMIIQTCQLIRVRPTENLRRASSRANKYKQERIPVGCVPAACQSYILWWPPDVSTCRACTVRSNASWVMVTLGPPVDKQTHTYENIIFPQFRWRGVTMSINWGAN